MTKKIIAPLLLLFVITNSHAALRYFCHSAIGQEQSHKCRLVHSDLSWKGSYYVCSPSTTITLGGCKEGATNYLELNKLLDYQTTFHATGFGFHHSVKTIYCHDSGSNSDYYWWPIGNTLICAKMR